MPFLIWEQYGSQLLYFESRYGTHNKLVVAGGLVSLACICFLLPLGGSGLLVALAAMVPSQITAPLAGVFVLTRIIKLSGSPIRPSLTELSALLRGGIQLHFATIGGLTASLVTVLIIHNEMGAIDAGYFQMAAQLVAALLLLSQTVCMVMYSEIARNGATEAWPQHRKLVTWTTFVTVLAVSIIAYLAPNIIKIVAGDGYLDVVPILRQMLVGSIGVSLSILMTPQWVGRGLFAQTTMLTLISAIINLSVLFLLLPHYGVLAGSLSYLATGIFSLLGNGIFIVYCNKATAGKRTHEQ